MVTTLKENPLFRFYKLTRIISFVCIPLWILCIILYVALRREFPHMVSNNLTPLLNIPLIAAITLFFSFGRSSRYWKELELRRQKAVSGDRSLLAQEQPRQEDVALPLVVTISVGKTYLWAISLVFLGIAAIATGYGLFLRFKPSDSDPTTSFFLWTGVGILVIGLFYILLIGRMGRRRIEATEENLTLSVGRLRTTIAWTDVHLFALYNAVLSGKAGAMYEVSSGEAIIQWIWIQHSSAKYGYAPSGSPAQIAEYNQKMQALLSVITDKTHMPLYDLR
jgi:hypothetical protein